MEHHQNKIYPLSRLSSCKINILYWNVEGISKFAAMHQNDQLKLLDNQIICLYETWQTCELNIPLFNRYDKVEALAVKKSNRGRGMGGLVVYFRNDIFKNHTTLENNQYFIIVRLNIRMDEAIILAVAYIQTPRIHDHVIEELDEAIFRVSLKYPNDDFILCGDFNGHVATKVDITSENIQDFGQLHKERYSMDKKVDSRGDAVLELANSHNFLLLNGRSISDREGNYTFAGGQGNSVIDLAFISERTIMRYSDFLVEDIIGSSHFPCKISLTYDYACHET